MILWCIVKPEICIIFIQPAFSAFTVLFLYIASTMRVERDPGEYEKCHELDSWLDFLVNHRLLCYVLCFSSLWMVILCALAHLEL